MNPMDDSEKRCHICGICYPSPEARVDLVSLYAQKVAKFILNDLKGLSKKYNFEVWDFPVLFVELFIKGEIEGLWTRKQVRKWTEILLKDMEECRNKKIDEAGEQKGRKL